MSEHQAETAQKSRRMRIGTFVVRCGLRIAYGKRDKYGDLTLRVGETERVFPPGATT